MRVQGSACVWCCTSYAGQLWAQCTCHVACTHVKHAGRKGPCRMRADELMSGCSRGHTAVLWVQCSTCQALHSCTCASTNLQQQKKTGCWNLSSVVCNVHCKPSAQVWPCTVMVFIAGVLHLMDGDNAVLCMTHVPALRVCLPAGEHRC